MKRWQASALLLGALALPACSAKTTSGNNRSVSPPAAATISAAAAAQPRYALRSNVRGASLVRIEQLAAVTPTPIEADNWCSERFVRPTSPGGKIAMKRGWRVVQETKFHQFEVVLIVRGLEKMTSSRCASIDANVAFFNGDQLVGVLYPKGKDGISIAAIEPVGAHLRVWSPDPLVQGQATLAGTSLTFDDVTGNDSVCAGKYQVPPVFSRNYSEARRMLIAAGWVPVPPTPEPNEYPFVTEYRKRFPEVESCSGTGWDECGSSFAARHGAATLGIAFFGDGDDPAVSGYSVACQGRTR
jgi:hypothetical protein